MISGCGAMRLERGSMGLSTGRLLVMRVRKLVDATLVPDLGLAPPSGVSPTWRRVKDLK